MDRPTQERDDARSTHPLLQPIPLAIEIAVAIVAALRLFSALGWS